MAKKYYLDDNGLTQVWNKIDQQNSKVVNSIKYIKSTFAQPSDEMPKNLEDEPEVGTSDKFSRADHVHLMPTYEDVGAAPYRKCVIEGYQNSEEKEWRVFADSYLSNGNTSITFLIRKTNVDDDSIGILTAFIKLENSNATDKALKWNLMSGDIDTQDFGLICEENDSSLIVKCSKNDNYMFEVLEEHNNYNDKESSWNLYDKLRTENNENIGSSEITYSTIQDIQNSCAAAHKLDKIVSINNTNFDGSTNIRLGNSYNYEFGSHTGNRYTTFCKIPLDKSVSDPKNSVSLIITDIAKYQYMIGGAWLIQAGLHKGVGKMKVTELITPDANGTKFGYYTTENEFCLVVYRAAAGGTFNITVLKQGNAVIEEEEWTSEQGNGTWQDVPTDTVLTNNNFEDYCIKEKIVLNGLQTKSVAAAQVDENGTYSVSLPNSIIVDIQSDKYSNSCIRFEHWFDGDMLYIKPYKTDDNSEIKSQSITNLTIYYMNKGNE